MGEMHDHPHIEQMSKIWLLEILSAPKDAMLDTAVLNKIESGNLTPEGWRMFLAQISHAAHTFEDLLRTGKDKAAQQGILPLQVALESNLRDEAGENEQGNTIADRSHHEWRRAFYRLLGATDTFIADTTPLPGAIFYRQTLEELRQEHVLTIAGALLMLEFFIPHEFRKLQAGRNRTFAKEFTPYPTDSAATLREKQLGKLYLDDHIIHDAQSHYPDILKALLPYTGNEDTFNRIKKGVDMIVQAHLRFHNNLADHL